jgi:hypothetical protein
MDGWRAKAEEGERERRAVGGNYQKCDNNEEEDENQQLDK